MKGWLLAGAAAAMLAQPAGAQTPQLTATGACTALLRTVEIDQRNLAYVHARGFLDQSAVQGTQRAAEEANILALLKMNLDLMAQHGCPMPSQPITRGGYIRGAEDCMAAPADRSAGACFGWTFDPAATEPVMSK